MDSAPVLALDIDQNRWRPAELLEASPLKYLCRLCGGVESSIDGWYVKFTDGPTLPGGRRWVKSEYVRKEA